MFFPAEITIHLRGEHEVVFREYDVHAQM